MNMNLILMVVYAISCMLLCKLIVTALRLGHDRALMLFIYLAIMAGSAAMVSGHRALH